MSIKDAERVLHDSGGDDAAAGRVLAQRAGENKSAADSGSGTVAGLELPPGVGQGLLQTETGAPRPAKPSL